MQARIDHILTVIALQVFLNAFVVGFTPPSSLIRLAVLPIIVACVYQVIPVCLPATGKVISAALLGAHSLSFLLQYIDTALLSKWAIETNGPTFDNTQNSRKGRIQKDAVRRRLKTGDRVRFGLYAAVSTRNVGTPFEVSGVPRFSNQDPSYVPTKNVFLGQKAASLIVSYLVLDILTFASQPEQNEVLYNSTRIPWANPSNISFEKFIVRSTTVLGFWISLYCIIQAYMGSVAFLSVAIGLSRVESWPPGYGPIIEAYTIRRFWGQVHISLRMRHVREY